MTQKYATTPTPLIKATIVFGAMIISSDMRFETSKILVNRSALISRRSLILTVTRFAKMLKAATDLTIAALFESIDMLTS
jgi:hypothetical protein